MKGGISRVQQEAAIFTDSNDISFIKIRKETSELDQFEVKIKLHSK